MAVKSADRTLKLLALFGARGQLRHAEVAELMDMPKTSTTVLREARTQIDGLPQPPLGTGAAMSRRLIRGMARTL
jgi:hypothetical protein